MCLFCRVITQDQPCMGPEEQEHIHFLNKVHADVKPSAGATAIGLQQQEKICCELM